MLRAMGLLQDHFEPIAFALVFHQDSFSSLSLNRIALFLVFGASERHGCGWPGAFAGEANAWHVAAGAVHEPHHGHAGLRDFEPAMGHCRLLFSSKTATNGWLVFLGNRTPKTDFGFPFGFPSKPPNMETLKQGQTQTDFSQLGKPRGWFPFGLPPQKRQNPSNNPETQVSACFGPVRLGNSGSRRLPGAGGGDHAAGAHGERGHQHDPGLRCGGPWHLRPGRVAGMPPQRQGGLWGGGDFFVGILEGSAKEVENYADCSRFPRALLLLASGCFFSTHSPVIPSSNNLTPGGKVLQAVCEATIWLTVFMCLVGYLIVVADSCWALENRHAVDGRNPLRTS